MKFIFPILAILVCGAAAYFTLTEAEKFETVQSARLEAIKTNKVVTANADAADIRIIEEKELLETSEQNLAVAKASVAALESDARTLKSDLTRLDSELAAQDTELEALQAALAQVQKVLGDLGGDVTLDNLSEKITGIEEDIKTKRAKEEELETLIEGAKSSLATKRDEIRRLADRKDSRNERIRRNAMEARVTAVNQDWGFLVIGAGSNSGFTPQTALLVKRDGRLIGRVNPSAIEPTQTIAEIELETLSPGVRLQPGDRVILAKPASN